MQESSIIFYKLLVTLRPSFVNNTILFATSIANNVKGFQCDRIKLCTYMQTKPNAC